MALIFTPRPKQAEVLAYQHGRMGVSAVPGSGKTWTLSLLAARLLLENQLAPEQEVLVVTLTNSAVDNFSTRVDAFLRAGGQRPILVPNYRVRTLHGLAHDIVRARPALVGLSENFSIIDERAAGNIRSEVTRAWLQTHPDFFEDLLDPELDEGKRNWVRRDRLPDLMDEIALSFIRTAKDLRLTPEKLRQVLDEVPFALPLLEMGWALFNDYQRALAYRGAVDFDDLIRLALQALEGDATLLELLQFRWPYILEDEAQDSSRLQEQILGRLAGDSGNWVRVGDPNQAIYETFTTASPEYLRAFIHNPFVQRGELPNSGRSTASIMFLANELIKWTMEDHPLPEARNALSPPEIEPAPPGDPQPNPPDAPENIYLVDRKYTAREEVAAVAGSLANWLPEHPDSTVAVLTTTNSRAFEMIDELKRLGLAYNDSLLRSSTSTRTTAGVLGTVLNSLANPDSARRLSKVLEAWRREERGEAEAEALTERAAQTLRRCRQVEDYLWPRLEQDWLEDSGLAESDPPVYALLDDFRQVARRWQATVLLPVDQIVLTLSQDLFSSPTDLAIAHKLALLLRSASDLYPDWRLPELTQELAVIARNERRFLGFSDDDTGFDPQRYPGVVVVATMHKAKGLEWDRVYLMSVNNYDFPSGNPYDQYLSEKWFLRGRLNLEAETRARLNALFPERALPRPNVPVVPDEYAWPEDGEPTLNARLEYIRERLRLLYVGITRARTDLIITWNTGRRGGLQPAVPFLELKRIWEAHRDETAG
jgi:DNA helicase-2/ATP-dependent DNA helicase PcrA